MVVSLVAAAVAAVCYGVATVLQALGTRRTEAAGPAAGLDPRLLVRVFKTWPFLAGTALDLVGFAAQLVALAELPVFAVEAAQAANLAVTAVIAVPVLGVALGRREWTAVGAVCAGLALLGLERGARGPVGDVGRVPVRAARRGRRHRPVRHVGGAVPSRGVRGCSVWRRAWASGSSRLPAGSSRPWRSPTCGVIRRRGRCCWPGRSRCSCMRQRCRAVR
ncbi:hypothetical protein ACU686_38405 [Yinghuangia aomiensis]